MARMHINSVVSSIYLSDANCTSAIYYYDLRCEIGFDSPRTSDIFALSFERDTPELHVLFAVSNHAIFGIIWHHLVYADLVPINPP